MSRKPAITGFVDKKMNNKNIKKYNKTIGKLNYIRYYVYVNKRGDKTSQRFTTYFIIILS